MADRDDRARARRPAARGCNRQRPLPRGGHQPSPDRGSEHVARLHPPRLPQHLDRSGNARRGQRTGAALRKHQPRASGGQDADLPGDLGAGGERHAYGARWLVPVPLSPRPACQSLRLFRGRRAGEVYALSTATHPAPAAQERPRARLAAWWPLLALALLAAAIRLSTLDPQRFWYDEAFTPVHVLHPSLWATLRAVVHSENTPPLWYVIAWADSRVLGTGEIALRLPSALAGIATVPVAWAIGAELERTHSGRSSRRAAAACAALVAVNPLFVWYCQEARAYGLFVLMAALTMLCFLRVEREPSPRRMAAFAATASL